MEEQVSIQKDGWGFLNIRISSSSAFLVPQKRYLTDSDFIGSSYPFSFYIDLQKMHAGNNYGSICFENDVQKEEIQVWVSSQSMDVPREHKCQKLQSILYQLTQCYIDYRLKKIVTG